MNSRQFQRMIALLIVAAVLGVDQLSKLWALTTLRQVGSTLVLPGPVDLTLVFNRSNAFGLVPVSGYSLGFRGGSRRRGNCNRILIPRPQAHDVCNNVVSFLVRQDDVWHGWM